MAAILSRSQCVNIKHHIRMFLLTYAAVFCQWRRCQIIMFDIIDDINFQATQVSP